ncbi:MAG: ABC transporter permease [Deltaproteobacteria bacterium]|nr:ABC transporter permease [Deltaproteobacteria bacterium]
MFDLDAWHEIWATLGANRLRTGLTAFGVVWGIMMLMAMLGFGSAMQVGTQRQMAGLATNTLFVWGQTTTEPYMGMPTGRPIRFDLTDIEEIRRIPEVEALAPRIQLGGFMNSSTATYGGKTGTFQIFGDFPDFQKIVTQRYLAGRFLNQRDIDERRKVCVLGKAVIEQLYPPDVDPIGTYVKINGVYFQVVGKTASLRSGPQGDRDSNTIFIPFTTFQQAFHTGERVGFFAMTFKPTVDGSQIESTVKALLARHHKFAPTDKLAVGSFNAFQVFNDISQFFVVLSLVVWIVGGATLVAGVIGVSNIMLITVKERTKEIGVRKALGATPLSVIAMVMKESVVLTTIAGLIGVALGTGIIALMAFVFEHAGPTMPFGPPDVGLGTALQAVFILVVSGALAGIMPAAHAASISPVEALRAE